uniref:Mucin-2-like n=1 Tax=Elaeis guineensis var. tenera TaxID=51953 RepID=A0A6J0PPP3_ELAGV|nr:mucin-2-like [Elaeis guineensis]
MAPKKNNKGGGQRSKTPGQTSESDPNPTATSRSASTPTGDATTAPFFHPPPPVLPRRTTTTTTQPIPLAPPLPSLSRGHHHPAYPLLPFFQPTPQITSLLPSSTSPSAPWTTTTQLIPSAQPQTTSVLPFSPSQITATTRPLPSAPPRPIRKTHQERVSCTSGGATTTDHAGPSTAPSASAASTGDFAPAVEGVMAAVRSGKKGDPAGLLVMVAALYGLRLDEMESILECLVGLAEKTKGNTELKAALEALVDVELLKSTARAAEILLAERKKRDGGGGSCGGSDGAGGGPHSGSGEGDGEGGGVSI